MDIPITVSVAKVDDPSEVTTRTVTVTTVSSDPVATIKGSGLQTIGVSSGMVEFDGSRSYDPDGQDELLQYSWTCRNLVKIINVFTTSLQIWGTIYGLFP